MKKNMIKIVTLALSAALLSPACAGSERASQFDFSEYPPKAEMCTLDRWVSKRIYFSRMGFSLKDGKRNEFPDAFEWKSDDGKRFEFVGKIGSDGIGWWFGTLNGIEAAGYNFDRRHYVIGTIYDEIELECRDLDEEEVNHSDGVTGKSGVTIPIK